MIDSRQRRALGWAALGALAIAAFATSAPWVFEGAEAGAPGWAGVVGGFDEGELQHYAVNLSRRLAVVLALVVGVALATGSNLRDAVASRVRPASAESVALMRIFAGATLTLSAGWEDLPSLAAIPSEMLRPPAPIIAALFAIPGFESVRSSETALGILQGATLVACLLATVGAKSRLSIPAAVLLYFLFGGLIRSPFKFFHTGLAPWFVMFVLAFDARVASHRWSVDARLRRRPPPTEERRARYGWLRFVGAATLAAFYVEAGLSKLCNGGAHWFEAVHMRCLMARDSLEPMAFDFDLGLALVRAPDPLLEAMGAVAMVGELAFVLVFFHRTLALLLPLLLIGMHVGILLTQNILFFDLMIMDTLFVAWWFLDRRQPASASAPSPDPKAQKLTLALLGTFAVTWTFGVEAYPLTAVQMYSRKMDSGVVTYHRLVAHHADGTTRRAFPEDAVGVLRDGRYRRTLANCFQDGGEGECRAFLGAARRWLNASPHRNDDHGAVRSLEAQRWRWAVEANRDDPEHGALVARVRQPERP